MGGGSSRGLYSRGIRYPSDDATKSPGKGFEGRGRGPVGSNRGSWFNPTTRESWYPNLNHPPPIGPHWDYYDPRMKKPNEFRVFKDGRIEPK
jgi:hypothetical protein